MMAKKTISVSLEEDLISFIDNVQKEKKLSSRSAALERLLLKLQNDDYKKEDIKKIVYEILQENSLNANDFKKEKNIPVIDENTLNSIEDAFNNMPE